MIILGVDPGLSGACAAVDGASHKLVSVFDMPTMGRNIDCAQLFRLCLELGITHAVVEDVHSMPKQGVSSTFTFGKAVGSVHAVLACLEIPTSLVTPGQWKKHYKLDSDKEKARMLAIRTWPGCTLFARKKDNGRAEAALIALHFAINKNNFKNNLTEEPPPL